MFSNIFRVLGTKSFKPLKFTNENVEYIDTDIDELGVYVHIPFCETLCSFCPYNKVKYDKDLALRYKEALLKEIDNVGKYYKGKKITSIYFGGGTPSLMINELQHIILALKDLFSFDCDMGIELHPRDVDRNLLVELKKLGFTMVSLGIQSFQEKNLKALGREFINGAETLRLAKDTGFNVIDVDLIFGIKGQNEEDLRKDFRTAFNNGATQVSTYPFIDFSYANNKNNMLGKKRDKKRLLNCLEDLSSELYLERTSVWTFAKKNTTKYSSITRDSYIGFGVSAASLTNKYFKINTFSVEEYINRVNEDKNPKALTMNFTPRLRAMYWMFWNGYTLELNRNAFKELLGKDMENFFGKELFLAKSLGLIKNSKNGYKLTKKGAYSYHLLEQHYTHEYIDKTWSICGKEPWPEEIELY